MPSQTVDESRNREGRRGPLVGCRRCFSERGVALLSVIAVLTALVLIATPFALSMHGQYQASVYDTSAYRARLAAESAVAYARGVVRESCQPYDKTPDFDDKAELEVDIEAVRRIVFDGIPGGDKNLISVRVRDEQGRINVNSASPYLLGSLFGKSRLAQNLAEEDGEIVLEDGRGFPENGGFVYVSGEMIQYASRSGSVLRGCRRGVAPDGFVYSEPLAIQRGTTVIDGRVIRMIEGRLSATDHTEVSYRSLDEVKRVCESGELFLPPSRIQEVEAYLTVHSMRADEKSWVNPQRVYGFLDDDHGLPTILAENGRYYAAGTVVKLTDGANVRTTIVARMAGRGVGRITTAGGNETVVQGDKLVLLGEIPESFDIDHLLIYSESRHAININTADDLVLRGLLTGLSVGGDAEDAVSDAEVDFLLVKLKEEVVESRQDLLERILFPAEQSGELSSKALSAIYRNVLNSNDRFVDGGTAPVCFKTFNTYSIEGTCILVNRAGIEMARHTVREVVHLAPQGESVFELTTQDEFEDQILPSRNGRWVNTTPFNVARFERDNNPPSRYFMNRVRKVFASRDREGDDGEDEGDVRSRPVRTSPSGGIRATVEHFDQLEDPEGYRTEDGPHRVSVQTSDGALVPVSVEFWFRPDDTASESYLVDYGRTSRTEDRLSLIYQPSEGRVVLEVADPAVADPESSVEEVSYLEYPVSLVDNTWYHFHLTARGSKPTDLTLMVDGNPKPAEAAFLTRLTSSVDASGTSLGVEDAESFPSKGVLLVGREIMPYTSRSKNSFTLGSNDLFEPERGARNTTAKPHEEGEAVTLLGYSNPLVSDVPVGGATLGSRLGLFEVAVLNAPQNQTIPEAANRRFAGINEDATEIPLRSLDGSENDISFLEAFQDSGFALIWEHDWEFRGTTVWDFGPELIYYGGISGRKLIDVTRRVATANSLTQYSKRRFHANVFPLGDPQNPAPTLVIPISIEAPGVIPGEFGNYLDPIVTTVSERAQIASDGVEFLEEWICYDSIEGAPGGGGGGYLVCNSNTKFNAVGGLYVIKFPGLADAIDDIQPPAPPAPPGPPGPRGPIVSPVGFGGVPDVGVIPLALAVFFQPSQNQGWGITSADIDEVLEFRGSDDTPQEVHEANDRIIPCFRLRGRGAGRDDYVTLITPEGDKVSHRVTHGRVGANFFDRGLSGLHNFVSLQENVSQRVSSTIRERLKQNGLHRGVSYGWKNVELSRVLKFPSGELPRIANDFFSVAARVDGSSPAIGTLDEVKRVLPQRLAYVMSLPPLVDVFEEDEADLIVYRADGHASDQGGIRPDDYVPSFGGDPPFSKLPPPINPTFELPMIARDGGILRIGEELMVYRDFEEQGGDPPTAVFKDLIRGFLGTPKSNHSRFEPVVPLLHLPLAVVDGGAGSDGAEIAVTDSGGFDSEGCLAVVNDSGELGELLIYTHRSTNLFTMPMSGDGEIGDGGGIFRGRYGTLSQSIGDQDVVLQMPIRYWDRYRAMVEDPELSFFQASVTIPSAFFTRISWDEILLKPSIDTKILVRIDGRARWEDPPLGVENGLFLFDTPITEQHSNRIEMQGDTIEIRVFFAYDAGAFNSAFTSDSWKETAWFRGLSLHYVAPSMTISREEE